MKRRVAVLLSAVLAVTAALVMSACSQEQADLLDEALKKDIKSADIALSVQLKAGDGKGIDLSLEGPFQSNGKDRLASFDWKVGGHGEGLEQFDGTRLISSGKNIFVVYQGETYEFGERFVAKLERKSAKETGDDIDSLDDAKQAGLDVRSWFPKSETEEDSKVADEDTTRVTGVLDLSAALRDIRDMVRSRGAGADAELKAFGKLSDKEIRKLDKVFQDPRFAIDVAKSDGKVRRIAAEARLNGGKQDATMRLVLEFRDVDEPVTIDAPQSGKPLRQLAKRLKRDGDKSQLGAATRPQKVS